MTKNNNYYTVSVNDPFKMIDNLWNTTWASTTTALADAYPPYNVIELDGDTRVLEFAVAGFDRTELRVEQDNRRIIVWGVKNETDEQPKYLHRGIAQRKFRKEYALWEFWNVESADLNNGILYIVIKREVPEEKKLKSIKIK